MHVPVYLVERSYLGWGDILKWALISLLSAIFSNVFGDDVPHEILPVAGAVGIVGLQGADLNLNLTAC